MKLEIGIDEAGYGPTLGPLVLGLVALRRPSDDSATLYQRLRGLVGRAPAGKDRLGVDDSKKLYVGRKSLERLEQSALAFALPGAPRPTRLEALVETTAQPAAAEWPRWYHPRADEPELPVDAQSEEVDRWRERLARTLAERDIEFVASHPVPILEPAFNESLRRTDNKAASLLSFVAPLIRDLPRRYPDDEVVLRVDRLGGRRYYEDFLASLFPFVPMRTEKETGDHSEYLLDQGRRSIRVSFETKADGRHFTVALASVLAKYTRELFLRRLNAHFARQIASLEPTAGYPEDASRFLDDIAGVLSASERRLLVRQR